MIRSDYRVLTPVELPNIDRPPFNNGRYRSEEDYFEYLKKGQPYFEEFERTGQIAEIAALIGRPLAGLSEHDEWMLDFEHNFLGPDCVTVEEQDGKYVLSSNGRHRMYVAKKNGLKLLVRYRWWED